MSASRLARRALDLAAVAAAAVFLVAATAAPLEASPRAWPIDLPTGDRYYVFTVGGSFPDGHKLEIWKETNGLLRCSIPEAPPVGHATEPSGQSGLQVTPVTCADVAFQADTRIVPEAEEQPRPEPAPTASPTPTPDGPPQPSGPSDPSDPAEPVATPTGSAGTDTPSIAAPAVISIGENLPQSRSPSGRSPGGLLAGAAAVGLVALGTRIERALARARRGETD